MGAREREAASHVLEQARTRRGGRLGSIAEQTVDTKVDVVLGGGRNRWLEPLAAGGTTNVIDYAKSKGYQYVENASQLEAVKSSKPVLGLFNPSNMTTEWSGPVATLGEACRRISASRPTARPRSRACRR